MQSILDNPEFMQQMIMSNPQMRQLMESNPQLASIFNNPDLLRQSMQVGDAAAP